MEAYIHTYTYFYKFTVKVYKSEKDEVCFNYFRLHIKTLLHVCHTQHIRSGDVVMYIYNLLGKS